MVDDTPGLSSAAWALGGASLKAMGAGGWVAYKYDVFLSYSRGAPSGTWVKENFHRALEESLTLEMPRNPQIFVDWRQETGISWPENLIAALRVSRVMVSVLSPPYFRSRWCVAEWNTMWQRQKLMQRDTWHDPNNALLHPVIFADGRHFPPEVHEIMHVDLSKWSHNLPYETYSRCPDYLGFLEAVRDFAKGLACCIDKVPEWQSDWPVMKVEPMSEAFADIPRL